MQTPAGRGELGDPDPEYGRMRSNSGITSLYPDDCIMTVLGSHPTPRPSLDDRGAAPEPSLLELGPTPEPEPDLLWARGFVVGTEFSKVPFGPAYRI